MKRIYFVLTIVVSITIGVGIGRIGLDDDYPKNIQYANIQQAIEQLTKDEFTSIKFCPNNCGYDIAEGIGFSAIYEGERTVGVIKMQADGKPSIGME